MTRKSLLSIVAGVADATFGIAGVTFMAAPMTVLEYAEYLELGDAVPDEATKEAFAAYPKLKEYDLVLFGFIASRLRLRLVPGQQKDPALLTPFWLASQLPQSQVGTLVHVLIHGSLPPPEEKKTTPP